MKQFTVAIIGAPNVGKSTLFNRLTGKRNILEANQPGTTRDRHKAKIEREDMIIHIVDCGGWNPHVTETIDQSVQKQTNRAAAEADVILFVFDGKSGITPLDKELSLNLRKIEKPIVYAVNKIDADHMESYIYEFYQLGITHVIPISALHNKNITLLIDEIIKSCPHEALKEEKEESSVIRLCFAGRPNTGKSTLINYLCGEERFIVTPVPGTTRDSTIMRIQYDDTLFDLIDTPGLRRKKKARNPLEGLMQLSTQKAIESADVVGLLIDAEHGITSGDIKIATLIQKYNRACFILINKWDIVQNPNLSRDKLLEFISFKLPFLSWAPVLTVSGKTGLKMQKILPLVKTLYTNYSQTFNEKQLKKPLANSAIKHKLVWNNKIVRIKKIRQLEKSPPIILLEVNRSEMLHFSHIRYLENIFREYFQLTGTPLIIKTNTKKARKKR